MTFPMVSAIHAPASVIIFKIIEIAANGDNRIFRQITGTRNYGGTPQSNINGFH